jgi:hypothetical protein
MNTIFWDVLPCSWVDMHQHFRGTCSVCLQANLPKALVLSTRLYKYGVTYQKTIIFKPMYYSSEQCHAFLRVLIPKCGQGGIFSAKTITFKRQQISFQSWGSFWAAWTWYLHFYISDSNPLYIFEHPRQNTVYRTCGHSRFETSELAQIIVLDSYEAANVLNQEGYNLSEILKNSIFKVLYCTTGWSCH